MSDRDAVENLVVSVLKRAGFSVGFDSDDGDFGEAMAIVGYRPGYHGETIAVYANVPAAHRLPEAVTAQAAMADLFARILFDAGITVMSSRAWKRNRLLLVPIDSEAEKLEGDPVKRFAKLFA